LEKVVIARTLQFHSNNRINPFSIFQKLLSSYPTCFNYYFELATDQVFLGASPELLLQKNNMSISTMALAGTTNRGIYEEGDIQLAKELLSSKKDRKEHQIVVQQIIDNLKSFIDPNTLSYGDTPHIHKIHNVQHLRTNISAQLKGEISLLEIISHLHPTPAVGGKPRSEALQLIRTIEGSRGWYASPVGYIKSNLDGKFIVGLRSALVQERIIHAFAGAGIVGASDPIKEWEETKLKFKPFLDALEVNNN
jgi:menaquinone-specific isochorismate synthase